MQKRLICLIISGALTFAFTTLTFTWAEGNVYGLNSPTALAKDTADAFDVGDYIAQKGVAPAPTKQSFGVILTTSPAVLGDYTASPSASPEPVATNSVEPSPLINSSPAPSANASVIKGKLTVAVLGDSMIDTMGPGLPDLKQELIRRFPGTSFTLLNYGVGASNIESGLNRLTNGYTYLGETKPALLSQNPDILVIESFAYNHWGNTQSDLDRQWLNISKIIEVAKSHHPGIKIVLAATIAPHCPDYTDGSANLPPERKYAECATVKAYLQNLVNFASSQHFPLADAYHSSLTGEDGNPQYINQGDHIHPSAAGRLLFSQKVAEAFAKIF